MSNTERSRLREETIRLLEEDVWPLFAYEGAVQWFWKGPQKACGGRVKSPKALYTLIQSAENAKQDLYLSLNGTRRCGVKAARKDVKVWRAIVIDLDPQTEREIEWADVLPTVVSHTQRMLQDNAVSQCITTLDSGRGRQLWLHLWPEEVKDQAAQIERGMSAFLWSLDDVVGQGLGVAVDTTCSDLARVVRCPYSINQKTGRRARILSRATDIGIFNNHIKSMARPIVHEVQQPPPRLKGLNQLLPYLNRTALRFLVRGVVSPGRHSGAYAAAKQLFELGLDVPTVQGFVGVGAGKCRPPLRIEEAERAVQTAWRRHEEGNDGNVQDGKHQDH